MALTALLASRWPVPLLTAIRRPTVGLAAAFVLLPLYVVVARERLDNEIETYVRVSLLPLLYFLLFLAGWARAYKPLVIGALVVATIAGIAWDLTIELRRIGYTLDTPADFLTGLASFTLGSYVHDLFDGRESTGGYQRWPLTTLTGLLLLWGGYLFVAIALDASGEYRHLVLQLAPIGSYHALPIAALFAGVRYRFRGVAAVTLIATAVEVLGPLLRLDGANLGTPLVAFAFAALGVHLSDQAAGQPTRWTPWRWVTLALFGVVGLPPLLELRLTAATDLAVLAAGVATLILAGMLVRSLLHRAGIYLEAAASRGWLALFGSVLLAFGMLSSLKDFWLESGAVVMTRSALKS